MDYHEMHCPLTVNTTRICGKNSVDTAIEVSKIGFAEMKPNAVILVNNNMVFDGIAASPLVHMPFNAPILFTDGNKLDKETLAEIKKLNSESHMGIHVILVGNISKRVKEHLEDLGLCVHHIAGCNHYETACKVLKERHMFKNILIMSGEDYSEGIVSTYWAAHNGDPILFVKKDKIPSCTLEAIKEHHDANVYIIGSTNTVSKDVEEMLERLDCINNVKRIHGDTPYSIAVNFAMYKDCKTGFGWGRNYKQGHAFTFGTLNHPMEIIAGVVFAHMGKHTPLLLIKKDSVPQIVKKYIEALKPIPPVDMIKPPFMHGFILGNIEHITYCVQVEIEKALSIDHHIMMMEMEEMMKEMKDEHEMEQMDHGDHMLMHHMMEHSMMAMKMEMEAMHKMNGDHEMKNMNHEHHKHDMMGHHHMNHNKHKKCGKNKNNHCMESHMCYHHNEEHHH